MERSPSRARAAFRLADDDLALPALLISRPPSLRGFRAFELGDLLPTGVENPAGTFLVSRSN